MPTSQQPALPLLHYSQPVLVSTSMQEELSGLPRHLSREPPVVKFGDMGRRPCAAGTQSDQAYVRRE
jgi:hypothetical protein